MDTSYLRPSLYVVDAYLSSFQRGGAAPFCTVYEYVLDFKAGCKTFPECVDIASHIVRTEYNGNRR